MSRIKVGLVLALALWVGIGAIGWGQQQAVVKDVRVAGNEQVPAQRILNEITFAPGDTIGTEAIQQSAQRIFDLGLFHDVRPDIQQDPDGVVITFQVAENPVVQEIQISGNRQYEVTWDVLGLKIPFFWDILKTERVIEILEEHEVALYEQVNLNNLSDALAAMRQEYEQQGYFWINIDQERMLRSLQSGEALLIPIQELNVEEIRIQGLNEELEGIARELISIPLNEPPKIQALQGSFTALNNSIYFESFDPASQENLQMQPGSRVDTLVLALQLRTRSLIDGTVAPERIDFEGNTVFSDERLRRQLGPWEPGTSLNNLDLLHVLSGAYDLYHDSGYTQMELTVDPGDGALNVSISEGRVRNVLVRLNSEDGYTELAFTPDGPTEPAHFALDEQGEPVPAETAPGHTKPYVVENALQIAPDEIFNENKLRDTHRTLMELEYFEDVQVNVEPVADEANRVDVSLSIAEGTKLGSFNGVLTANDSGLVGKLSLSEKNLFGTGQDVSLEYDRGILGPALANWSLVYTTHGFFQEFKDFTVRLFQTFERPTVEEEITRTGGELSVTYPLSSTTDLRVGGRHENFQECARGGESCEPPGVTDSITLGWINDTRDNPAFAMEGGRRVAEIEQAGGFSVGTEFTKLTGSAVQHLATLKDQNVAVRLMSGWGVGGGGEALPSQERFSLGGPATVRGLTSKQVDAYLVLNTEYRVKWLEQFSTAAFVDWGLGPDAWGEDQHLRGTAGIEARVSLPFLGTVRFALAWELRSEFTLIPRFSFAFGPMF